MFTLIHIVTGEVSCVCPTGEPIATGLVDTGVPLLALIAAQRVDALQPVAADVLLALVDIHTNRLGAFLNTRKANFTRV